VWVGVCVGGWVSVCVGVYVGGCVGVCVWACGCVCGCVCVFVRKHKRVKLCKMDSLFIQYTIVYIIVILNKC
jgi:hypothetical protein